MVYVLEENMNPISEDDIRESSLKAIIFDFDGTLADSFPFFLKVFTYEIMKKKKRMIRKDNVSFLAKKVFHNEILKGNERIEPKMLLMRVFYITCRELGITRKSSVTITLNSLYKVKKYYKHIKMFAGAENLLKSLYEANIFLILITHSSKKNIMKILEKTNVDKYFTIILDRKDTGTYKTSGIRKSLEALGVNPENAVSIGDLPADISEAKITGVTTVGFSSGVVDKTLLAIQNPDFIVENMYQLAYIVKNI